MRTRISSRDIDICKGDIIRGIGRFYFYDHNPRYIASVIEKLGILFFQNGYTSEVGSEKFNGKVNHYLKFKLPQSNRRAA